MNEGRPSNTSRRPGHRGGIDGVPDGSSIHGPSSRFDRFGGAKRDAQIVDLVSARNKGLQSRIEPLFGLNVHVEQARSELANQWG